MPASLRSEMDFSFVCAREELKHNSCGGEPSYQTSDGVRYCVRYCVLHFPGKEKSSADFGKALERKLENKDFNFRWVWFPYQLRLSKFDFDGDVNFSFATFNEEADFSSATFSEKADFSSATFRGKGNFDSATFSAALFESTTFSDVAILSSARFGAMVSFERAAFDSFADFSFTVFSIAVFEFVRFSSTANFNRSTYSGSADFWSGTFSEGAFFNDAIFAGEVDFSSATFNARASFTRATFQRDAFFTGTSFNGELDRELGFPVFTARPINLAPVDFNNATFSAEADFRHAAFNAKADFGNVHFEDYAKFAGKEKKQMPNMPSMLDFQFARVNNPDHVSFHTLTLRTHWFVNVDARRFDFTNVNWNWRSIKEEIESLEGSKVSSPHRLLAIACRQLAINAEENHRYEEASKFRYMAMDAGRRSHFHGFAFWRLSWWYWLASGYGERVLKAFLILLGILLLSALLYNHVGFARWESKLASESDVASVKQDDMGAPLKFSRALTYSAAVMTFQKPEPRPATPAAQTVVLLETILGPVQAALLALAIRRKFMR